MKKFTNWICFLFIYLIICAPSVGSKSEMPYLAVYQQPGFNFEWKKYDPDLFFTGADWRDFSTFLYVVKKKAGNRPIIIDVDCHGFDNLAMQYKDIADNEENHQASLGYICNEIDRQNLNEKKLTLILEACFAGRVYKKSMRGADPHLNAVLNLNIGDKWENYNKIPKYPILGMDAQHFNVCNFSYLQYRYNFRPYLKDLRMYEDIQELPEPDLNHFSPEVATIKSLWATLFLYGQK
jgi:hypothetical protein